MARRQYIWLLLYYMSTDHLQVAFRTPVTAEKVFGCINAVEQWWTENLEGKSGAAGDRFSVQFGDVHFSVHEVVKIEPYREIVWLITDSKLSWLQQEDEWTGTRIIFNISEDENGTLVTFTHEGLTPAVECFKGCQGAWQQYVGDSLRLLIANGKGNPDKKIN